MTQQPTNSFRPSQPSLNRDRDYYTRVEVDRLIAKAILSLEERIGESLELSGTPTAPTPPQGTSNSQIATTAYVNQAITEALNS